MAKSRYTRCLVLLGIAAGVWLLLLMQIRLDGALRGVAWLRIATGALVGEVAYAIAVCFIASYDELHVRRFADNFKSRMASALSTALALACIRTFIGYLGSLLPSAAGNMLGSVWGILSLPLVFSTAIAGATRKGPRKALAASVRFFFSKAGIKLGILTVVVLFLATYPLVLLANHLWPPVSHKMAAAMLLLGLLAGIVTAVAAQIWLKFKPDSAGGLRNGY